MTLNYFIRHQIRIDGLWYFIRNYRACIAHCKNQKRLYDESQDRDRQEAVKRYVDALYAAGDVR
jgi:hypothetical protein